MCTYFITKEQHPQPYLQYVANAPRARTTQRLRLPMQLPKQPPQHQDEKKEPRKESFQAGYRR